MSETTQFEFRRVLTPIGFVYVPIALVQLGYHRNSVELEMTIDSGADLCMIPYQVGHAVGMRRNRGNVRQLTGVAGDIPYIMTRVRLEIGGFAFPTRVAWALRDDVPILLGRVDVFNHFVITFDERRRQVTFRR